MVKRCKMCNRMIVVPEWASDEHKRIFQLICYQCAKASEEGRREKSIVERFLDSLELRSKPRKR